MSKPLRLTLTKVTCQDEQMGEPGKDGMYLVLFGTADELLLPRFQRGHQMLKAREQELVGGAEKNEIHSILSGFAHLFVLTGDLRERESEWFAHRSRSRSSQARILDRCSGNPDLVSRRNVSWTASRAAPRSPSSHFA